MFNFLFNNNNESTTTAPASNAVLVQFALEETRILVGSDGMAVREVLARAAEDLGFRADRITTVRVNGSCISFESTVKGGDVLTLSISAESKGC